MYDEIMVDNSNDIAYLPTESMTADLLSKPVQGAQFYKFAHHLQETSSNSN